MISELDILLSKFIENHIKSELGSDTIQKIKNRLYEKGYSLTQAINEFDPFDKTLREFFGRGADGMLQKICNKIFEIKKDSTGNPKSLLIKDKKLTNVIFETYGNKDKKAILMATAESALSVSRILKKVHLTQSTGYRIIGSLIDDGLLVEAEQNEVSSSGKRISMYKSTLPILNIKIKKASIEVEIQFNEEIVRNSHIIEAVMFLFGKPRV